MDPKSSSVHCPTQCPLPRLGLHPPAGLEQNIPASDPSPTAVATNIRLAVARHIVENTPIKKSLISYSLQKNQQHQHSTETVSDDLKKV